MKHSFTHEDEKSLNEIGISLITAKEQLALLEKGAIHTHLDRPATIGDGILTFTEKEINKYNSFFESNKQQYTIARFIPASGMASRMFKFLHYFFKNYNPEKDTLRSYLNRKKTYKLAVFLGGIEKLPFYAQVRGAVNKRQSGELHTDYRNRFIERVIDVYSVLPKALIPFHNYENTLRTAAEEQLFLSKEFIVNRDQMNIHFTIPPKSKKTFNDALLTGTSFLQTAFSITTNLEFSHQKETTNTIALSHDNTPLRDVDGQLVLRAGGHGSLIGNLNSMKEKIIFLSNIDNISVQKYHLHTAKYKKLLGGVLMSLLEQVYHYCRALEIGKVLDVIELKTFATQQLNIQIPDDLNEDALILFLKQKLSRPLRVCGMVKNEGEPGGGPFWVQKGSEESLQIVEEAQVHIENKHQKSTFKKGTHFNPVDIVCATHNFKGEKYDLRKFVDEDSFFMTIKSYRGNEIKALEHPGLWNGAMADWNTVFVEVPVRTFNPVKTVNDLLRPMHQNI